jgi:hypothetical protein
MKGTPLPMYITRQTSASIIQNATLFISKICSYKQKCLFSKSENRMVKPVLSRASVGGEGCKERM